MINTPVSHWQDSALKQSLANFDTFSTLLGLDSFADYFLSKNASRAETWSDLRLDEQGMELRDRIQNSADVSAFSISASIVLTD